LAKERVGRKKTAAPSSGGDVDGEGVANSF